jgi:hypothetical protein
MRFARSAPLALALALLARGPALAQHAGLEDVLARVEAALGVGDAVAYGHLLHRSVSDEDRASYLSEAVRPGVTRVVLRERDRVPLSPSPLGEGVRIVAEVLYEFGRQGAVATYRLDLRQVPPAAGSEGDESGAWRIVAQRRLTAVDGLQRLELDRSRQFDVSGLTLRGEDLTLTMAAGTAFVATAPEGPTAIVLLGDATLTFAPPLPAEQTQIRIFGGDDALITAVTAAFVRLHPADLPRVINEEALRPVAVQPRLLARAEEVFAVESPKSFVLDLSDLSRDPWSLVPPLGDLLLELRTRKYRTLTYARSTGDAEDISFFDRARRRNISVYPSERRRNAGQRGYDEDEHADIDVLEYDIDLAYSPDREWLDGRARLRLQVRAFQQVTLTLKLHDALVLRSVTSEEFGRLLALRVRNQNSVLLTLPEPLRRGSTVTLALVYSGRLPGQVPDRDVVTVSAQPVPPVVEGRDAPMVEPQARHLYSNRSWWYPQSPVTDYATARLRITVPGGYTVVASGDGEPVASLDTAAGTAPGSRRFSFVAGQPVRYLAWVASRLTPVTTTTLTVPSSATLADTDGTPPGPGQHGVYYNALSLGLVANPRHAVRRALVQTAAGILSLYAELTGDFPYPSLTLALVDNPVPGGHSPAYFSLLYQPLPGTPYSWRGDPVNFDSFPDFFLAHELAHQYWGQAVGWKSYHEQWISEGFAQYFAVLYAERTSRPGEFRDLLSAMRRSAIDYSRRGPVFLGYRLGHIEGDSRVFRALVYNKGALVLHMLRRLIGEDPFFAGLRTFYREYRFRKAGTDDVRAVFERVSGRSLAEFFDYWVYGSGIPRVTYRYAVDPPAIAGAGPAGALRIALTQAGAPVELPLTVTLVYRSGAREERVVGCAGAVSEHRLPLREPLRAVRVNDDRATLAIVDRR